MQSSSDYSCPRTRSGILRSYAGTTLFCVAIALVLWTFEIARPLWASMLVSFSIGYSVNTGSLLLQPLLMRLLPPIAAVILTALISIGVGAGLGSYLLYGDVAAMFSDYSIPLLGLFFGVLGILFFTTQQRLQDTRTALADARADQLDRERALLETQLRLLQAQIEPHFLFNTLSNVVGLIREQPRAAEKMLLDLTTLLRASLNRTRTDTTTLGDELTLVEALLEINRVRMGTRLSWTIEVDSGLRPYPLPPMLLQPLVENAVKHGIEPLEEGGSVVIRARAEDDRLTVVVEDTGAGPNGDADGAPAGVGVRNVQTRLAALFGQNASLTLEEGVPRGMVATLSIPASPP